MLLLLLLSSSCRMLQCKWVRRQLLLPRHLVLPQLPLLAVVVRSRRGVVPWLFFKMQQQRQ
jgi:hypothetical protein